MDLERQSRAQCFLQAMFARGRLRPPTSAYQQGASAPISVIRVISGKKLLLLLACGFPVTCGPWPMTSGLNVVLPLLFLFPVPRHLFPGVLPLIPQE